MNVIRNYNIFKLACPNLHSSNNVFHDWFDSFSNLFKTYVVNIGCDDKKWIICGAIHNSNEWNWCKEIKIIYPRTLNICSEHEIRKWRILYITLVVNKQIIDPIDILL